MSEPRTYHNPVQRGFFPDPSVIRVGDDYYMVNSSFQYFPAIPISHSRDMVHWHIIGHAITNPEWLDISDIRDSHGIWAPDIEYVDGKYYIYVTLRLNADGKRDNNVMRRQLVMVSDKPEGPYSKPVCLEVDDIDPSLFVDTTEHIISHAMYVVKREGYVREGDMVVFTAGDPATNMVKGKGAMTNMMHVIQAK